MLLSTALVGVISRPINAQETTWDWSFTPYLWAAGVDGSIAVGPANADISLSFGDIVDILDGAALVHIEAHKPGYALFGHLVYLGTEPTAGIDFDTLTVEGGYLSKSAHASGYSGWELGVRYWDFESKFDLANLPSQSGGKSWTDAFFSLRTERARRDRCGGGARANIGAGGSDFSWYESSDPRRFAVDATCLGLVVGYVFG